MSPTFRALRVGVLLGENLVEERLFRPATLTAVTFGQALRCTLSVPAEGVPTSHVLFAIEQGQLQLHTTPQMTGRVVQGDRELALSASSIPLSRGARGKLRIGDATILFQEVAAPPIAPRPQLPASVRGTFADRIDRRLAGIVALSLVVHLGIASWAWLTERESDSMVEEIAAQYDAPQYEIIDMPDFELPPAPAPSSEPGVAAPVKPQQLGTKPKPRDPVIDRLPDPADAERWAQMLTGNTPGRDGPQEISNRVPDTDLDRQIKTIKDGDHVVTNGSNRPTSRDRDLRIGDGPPGPKLDDPGITQIAKEEKKPIARITPIPMPKPPGKDPLSINAVLARIQGAYMAGLQRCYVKHGLATDASMVAKVTISFVVDPTGKSTENQAKGANAEVDACIHAQMAGWSFQVPKDDDGDPTDAPFKLQLALQPS